MSEAAVKFFTPAEAQRTLPLVKKIVKDILNCGYQIKTIAESTGGKIDDNEEAQKMIEEINGYMKELEEIGCYFKDWNYSIGLVDFPSIINGEEVYLCWRSDEQEINFYHEIEAGYNGRKPIPDYLK